MTESQTVIATTLGPCDSLRKRNGIDCDCCPGVDFKQAATEVQLHTPQAAFDKRFAIFQKRFVSSGVAQFIKQEIVVVIFDADNGRMGLIRKTGQLYAKQFVVMLQLAEKGDDFPAAGDFVMRRVAIPL